MQSAIFNVHMIHYESIQHEVLQTQHFPSLHTGVISYLCSTCLWRVASGLHMQEFECLLTPSGPQDLGPFHNWIVSLCTINNWEGRMPPDSSEQWVFRLLWESMLPSRQEFWPTAWMMGWSVPKAADSASADLARFQHWLPWLGEDCSPCGINISTCCLTLDWASKRASFRGVNKQPVPLLIWEHWGMHQQYWQVPWILTRRGISTPNQ